VGILWYVRDPKRYVSNGDAADPLPHVPPRVVGPERARRGTTDGRVVADDRSDIMQEENGQPEAEAAAVA